MRRIARIVVSGVFLAGFGGHVLAADMPPEPPYQVPPVVVPPVVAPPAPVYSWTGIYFGINGGYGFGKATPMALYSDGFSAFNFNANGFLGGATIGAQIQSGHTLLGIEGDIDWTNTSGSGRGNVFFNGANRGTATLSSTISSISTLRMRVGYALDNWLIYGTGGLAVTNEASTLTGAVGFVCGNGAAGDPPCTSLTNLHLGLSAGAGVEYGITQNLSAKAEYMWVGAGALNTLQENIIRAGLNWRFGM